MIYAVSKTGSLYALNSQGQLLWHRQLSITTDSVVIDRSGVIYFAKLQNTTPYIVAMDAGGTAIWQYQLADQVNVTLTLGSAGEIYAVDSNHSVLAIDSSGQLMWSNYVGSEFKTQIVIGQQQTLLVPTVTDQGPQLLAINATDGEQQWRYSATSGGEGSAAVDANGVIYYVVDEQLVALSASGEVLWAMPGFVGTQTSHVVIDHTGRILVNSASLGTLVVDGQSNGPLDSSWPMNRQNARGTGALFDVTLVVDSDGDGIVDTVDNCPNIANTNQINTDQQNDGGDACDADDDNDGVDDNSDLFPLDGAESVDNDGDGIGDNRDTDDDNDGLSDIWEETVGLDSKVYNDPNQDYNQDGLTLKQKFINGLDLNAAYTGNKAGLLQWKFDLATVAMGFALDSNQQIYLTTKNTQQLVSLTDQGDLRWTVDIGYDIVSTPVVDTNNTIYVVHLGPQPGSYLTAFSDQGQIKWQRRRESSYDNKASVATDASGQYIYWATQREPILAFDANGTLLWQTKEETYQTALGVNADGSLYL